jgi:hypothetical protein
MFQVAEELGSDVDDVPAQYGMSDPKYAAESRFRDRSCGLLLARDLDLEDLFHQAAFIIDPAVQLGRQGRGDLVQSVDQRS